MSDSGSSHGDGYRQMVCPFCRHEAKTSCIGSVHCGPHKLQGGKYEPAVRMIEKVTPTPGDYVRPDMEETLKIEIRLGNVRMQDPDDVADAVENVAKRLRTGYRIGTIRDVNENHVGAFCIVTEVPERRRERRSVRRPLG